MRSTGRQSMTRGSGPLHHCPATPGLDHASAFSPLESDCWTKRKEKRRNFPKRAERVSVWTCVQVHRQPDQEQAALYPHSPLSLYPIWSPGTIAPGHRQVEGKTQKVQTCPSLAVSTVSVGCSSYPNPFTRLPLLFQTRYLDNSQHLASS